MKLRHRGCCICPSLVPVFVFVDAKLGFVLYAIVYYYVALLVLLFWLSTFFNAGSYFAYFLSSLTDLPFCYAAYPTFLSSLFI